MPRRHHEDHAVGEDAFLDTTANLVGILIILVVVIGTKTKMDAEAYGREVAEQQPIEQLERPAEEARALHASLESQNNQRRQYALETQYRKLERDSLLTRLTVAREAIEEHLQDIGDDRRQQVELEQRREKLASQVREVNERMGAADETQRSKVVLEHLPTPMARTVFSREMHVQLRNGKVTVIPWDRLIDSLKQQVPLAARRQASRGTLDDKLGPIGGFLMKYRMQAVSGGFELDRFELEEVSQAGAESLSEAFSPAGRLRLELASRDPAETVVTVWIYPESFDRFRELKVKLMDEGFLSAARPLPEGVAIGASPRGTRSSAQ